MDHPQLNKLYVWLRLWEEAAVQGGLLDICPTLRYFGNKTYKKIRLARKMMKEQMDPYTENSKVECVTQNLTQCNCPRDTQMSYQIYVNLILSWSTFFLRELSDKICISSSISFL